MNAVLGIVGLVVLIGGYLKYTSWLEKSIRPRTVVTKLEAQQLRRIFGDKVATLGWKIVDDGNPMVAQSSLAAGIRQQISLKTEQDGERTKLVVAPTRTVKKVLGGAPTKAHTLRMRLNSFVSAVQSADPTAKVH